MPSHVQIPGAGLIKDTWLVKMQMPPGMEKEEIRIPVGGRMMRMLILRRAAGACEDAARGAEADSSRTAGAPGVLWLHGGGYLLGMPEMAYMSRAADLVMKGRAVVVSPEYTLSLRAPYPAALRDCHAALVYMRDHAAELGIRDDQIMVGGESAGGGLTAALCMYAKDHRTVNIAYQMPIYPMLDCFDTPSSANNHGKVWNTRRNHIAWRIYLRSLRRKKSVPSWASPSRRRDYSGLPPCYTFVGDIDAFRDETLAYARALDRAGVPVRVDVWEGFYHACDMKEPERADVQEAAAIFLSEFEAACRTYHAPQEAYRKKSAREEA